ncbi:MAG: aldo/keto reductase, partial [Actinomycetales bacterium]|nr:aldo/keto reductase [Actinomycetales bacterium]
MVQLPSNPLLELEVPLGFGFMNASWGGAPTLVAGPARDEFKRALQHAMDAGVTLFDTADIYAPTWDSF